MTVTVEFAPVTRPRAVTRVAVAGRPRSLTARAGRPVPSRVRACGTPRPTATARAAAAPVVTSSTVRLTRRGWALLLGAAALVAALLVVIGALSYPAGGTGAAGTGGTVAAVTGPVTVQAGDTLWSIAARVAPEQDPRAVVWALQQRNHLADVTVVPGQVLDLP